MATLYVKLFFVIEGLKLGGKSNEYATIFRLNDYFGVADVRP